MPEPIKFRCPICRCRQYETVNVPTTGGGQRPTPFYSCCGCSVMFRDPDAFTRFEPDRGTGKYSPQG